MKLRTGAALIAGALSLWLCGFAGAQNYICPTQSPGDNETLCASTQFVQQAISGGGTGTFAPGQVLGNGTGSTAAPAPTQLSPVIDQSIGLTRGSVLERGAAGWQIVPPGTSGLPWVSNGAGADPGYQQLTGVAMPAFTGDVTSLAGTVAMTIATGVVTNPKLANMAAAGLKGATAAGPVADLTGLQAESVLQFLQAGTGANQRSLDSEIKLACPHSLDFATGNGSTDDTTALQNWITQAQNIGCAYLDAGTYKISSVLTISSPLSIYGSGLSSIIVPSSTTQNAFSVTTTFPVNFYNFQIAPSGTQTAGACILVSPSPGENSGSHYENMSFSKCWNSIDFERASGFFVGYNTFVSNVAQAIIVRNLNNADSGDSVIEANNFQNALAGSSVGIYQESSGGLKIVGNKINTFSVGYELNVATGVTSSIVVLNGNSIENCGAQCILLTTQTPAAGQWRAVQIVGNELMCAGATQAIKITAASTPSWILGVTIDANNILINNTGTGGTGINVDNATAVIVSHNYIEDLGGGAGTGINFTVAASLGQISQNNPRSFPAGSWITNASTTTVIDDFSGIAFANAPAAAQNGSRIFFTDGTPGVACAGASTGSTGFRQNGAWKCF